MLTKLYTQKPLVIYPMSTNLYTQKPLVVHHIFTKLYTQKRLVVHPMVSVYQVSLTLDEQQEVSVCKV
jgi:hypothetical protein